MAKSNTVDLETTILSLLRIKKQISIHDVAQKSGRSLESQADRRAIQRAFKNLSEREIIEATGHARARVYNLISIPRSETESVIVTPDEVFKGIPLSKEAEKLLTYISQPIQARAPIGYDQNFLESYVPNKTFYLSASQRNELMNVGQVENKIRPAGTYARDILGRLLVDLAWNSSRLEGNTYSLLETKQLIELGKNAAGKDASEAQMILNHKEAIEYIVESSADEQISSHEVCSVHALLSENLLGDPAASGRLRTLVVGITGTTYLPLENPHTLKECFELFIEKLNLIEDPFEQSIFSIVQLSYLQAFEDVNKRTARIVANIPLIKENLRPLSFTDVHSEAYVKSLLGVYEKNDVGLIRDLFLWAYKRSAQRYSAIQQAMGEPNLLKLKYRALIQKIIRAVILDKVSGNRIVAKVKNLLKSEEIPEADANELFKVLETEILSLHDGNIARFKIRPSEFQKWKKIQK